MTGGHGWGVACGYTKALGRFPFPHQRKVCIEGLQGQHALIMLGRTLIILAHASCYNCFIRGI